MKINRTIIAKLITLLLLAASIAVYAQTTKQQQTKNKAEQQAEKSKQPKKAKPKKPKTFKPTEEISEDRPVPFPIDI